MKRIGIDIGGTKIAAGIVDENLHILCKKVIPTDITGGKDAIITDIIALVKELKREQPSESFDVVGIGCPGTIDSENGIVMYANNLCLENAQIAQPLQKELNMCVCLENDANCAGWGEYLALECRDRIHSFLMLTFGTGIGSAAIIEGKMYKGFNGGAPELGHCILQAGGTRCDCGAAGCWEMYCSGHALISDAKTAANAHSQSILNAKLREKNEHIDGSDVFEAFRAGDEIAREVIERYLFYYKIGIANAINAFQPEVLALGGGICEQGDILIEAAKAAAKNGSYCKTVMPTTVVKAKLGTDAGLIGAAFLKT